MPNNKSWKAHHAAVESHKNAEEIFIYLYNHPTALCFQCRLNIILMNMWCIHFMIGVSSTRVTGCYKPIINLLTAVSDQLIKN